MFDGGNDVLRFAGDRADTTNIHQVAIVDGMELPDIISDVMLKSRHALELVYPEARYKLWSGNALRAFIGHHFNDDVLHAFDSLKPYAFKNDLARLCLLYMTGGVYCDLAISPIENMAPTSRAELVVFWDIDNAEDRPNAISNGLIWAQRGSSIIKAYIEDIVSNAKVGRYGFNALCATGPYAFGRVVRNLAWPSLRVASSQRLVLGQVTRSDEVDVDLNFLVNGRLVAQRISKGGGDMSFSKLAGTNNYNEIWNSGEIYGEMRESVRVGSKNSRLSRSGGVEQSFALRVDLPFLVTCGLHHFMIVCEVDQPVLVKCVVTFVSDASVVVFVKKVEQVVARHIEFIGTTFHTMNEVGKVSILIEGDENVLRNVREVRHAVF